MVTTGSLVISTLHQISSVMVSQGHIITLLVCLQELGDSWNGLSACPSILMRVIGKWLNPTFGGKFKFTGDSLVHGVQRDFSSCAVVCENTIVHATVGNPLWKQENWTLE